MVPLSPFEVGRLYLRPRIAIRMSTSEGLSFGLLFSRETPITMLVREQRSD